MSLSMNINNQIVVIGDLKEFDDDPLNGAYVVLDRHLYRIKTIIRPPFQREFIYDIERQRKVIDTILHGYPLNIIYFSSCPDGTWEVLDGQQRILSILHFIKGDYSIVWNGETYYYHNLPSALKDRFNSYPLLVYLCEGNESDKLSWFSRINIQGIVLNDQELINATYHGPFISDARLMFAKPSCRALKVAQIGGKMFISGNPMRQDILETALSWASYAENISIKDYVARHQHDENADALWEYFAKVTKWVKEKFTFFRKEMTSVKWGVLYHQYKNDTRTAEEIEAEVSDHMKDDEITRKAGIYEFIFSRDERVLSLRKFSDTQKRTAYEKQGHRCAHCGEVFPIESLQADHILAWSKGGKTTPDNLQLLCAKCNNSKSDK